LANHKQELSMAVMKILYRLDIDIAEGIEFRPTNG